VLFLSATKEVTQMSFAPCTWVTNAIANAVALLQPKLKKCDGTDMPADSKIPTCDELDAAAAAATAAAIAAIPLATTTVAGLIEEATGEETLLGATDANKDDRAVTPGSMSYALQTGKNYNIDVRVSGFENAAIFKNIDTTQPGRVAANIGVNNVTGASYAYGTYSNIGAGTSTVFAAGINGGIEAGVTTASGVTIGTVGQNSSAGTGRKEGIQGRVTAATGASLNIGVYGVASGGATNWAGYFDGNVAGGAYTTLSDATLKENVQPIDPAKALQFRNGLQQKSYEMFTEQQVEIVDEEGKPTGRYKVERNSQGFDFGYIAQDVKALTEQIGAFQSVVSVVGEYFTLDAEGYPVKDTQGNKIVNKRLGLNYSAMNIIIAAAEQYDASVSKRQAWRALHDFGLLEKVKEAVAGADAETQIDWETAQSFNRNYGAVTDLAKKMGMSDKELDKLFAHARTL
jgi:hypothetical protein